MLYSIFYFYSAPERVRGIVINPYVRASVCLSVCLSASISLEPMDRSAWNFVCGSPVTVARSSYEGIALRYVLPLLWMTSHLAVMGATPARVGSTQCWWSITWATGAESGRMLVFSVLIPLSHQISLVLLGDKRDRIEILTQCAEWCQFVAAITCQFG